MRTLIIITSPLTSPLLINSHLNSPPPPHVLLTLSRRPNPNEVSDVAYLSAAEVKALFATAVAAEEGRAPAAADVGVLEAALGGGEEGGSSDGAAVAVADGGEKEEVLRVTPWSRHIVEGFVFDWWRDLNDADALARHADWQRVHRMGECAANGWSDPSEVAAAEVHDVAAVAAAAS